MRNHAFPAHADPPISLFRDDAPLKAHPAYAAAKAGDAAAAVALVLDLAESLAEQAKAAFGPGHIYVAPHAHEAAGDNAIPQVLADALANATCGAVDHAIVQANRVYHTGADPMERLNNRAVFDGDVRPGACYVLVDDVTTMGGTLAELAHHVQSNGEIVKGAVVIVNASRSGRIAADPRLLEQLEKRHGNAIREIFRISPAGLTADEARYLIGFRSADEIRNRSAKARQETDQRLRAKGIDRLGGKAG